ncbi:MAG: cytochrome-c oxidase, cbb3-type subunit III [Pseudomonadota bacterium]
MSDFFSGGWSVFITVAVLGGLVACLVLLFAASRRKPMAADNSTGHVWDEDLTELNNPLPRWWMVLFVLTVLFGVGYALFYPTLGSAPGKLDWTSGGQYKAEQDRANAAMAQVYAGFNDLPADKLARDSHAMAIGERLFINNCAACHGSDARGSKGFPNLTDSDWLHGGTPDKIEETITRGRIGSMPPMVDAIGGAAEARNVAHYVLSLSGSPHNDVLAYSGKAKFSACAACHGADGKGNTAIGAPNLADGTWLHGYGEQAIVAMVTNGKTNVMPAQEGRLTPGQIHVLASYVWSLSNSAARP